MIVGGIIENGGVAGSGPALGPGAAGDAATALYGICLNVNASLKYHRDGKESKISYYIYKTSLRWTVLEL